MRRYQHALLGGTFIGILSSLPVVNAANCCCLWVVAGGVLTAYLQQQNQEHPLEAADAALGGLLAGLLGATIHLVLTAVMYVVAGAAVEPEIQSALQDNPQIPAEVKDTVMRLLSGPGFLVLMAAFWVPVYSVVSTLGALLGLAMFKKKVLPADPV
jgi:Na+/H+ antiporter NhaD/arsenite permease-like protein